MSMPLRSALMNISLNRGIILYSKIEPNTDMARLRNKRIVCESFSSFRNDDAFILKLKLKYLKNLVILLFDRYFFFCCQKFSKYEIEKKNSNDVFISRININ